MKIIEKLKDIVLGPRKAVVIDSIEECGLNQVRYRFLEAGPTIPFNGSDVGKCYGITIGKEGQAILKELDSGRKHSIEYCVVDIGNLKGYQKDIQLLNPNLISEEQLDIITKKTGVSFDIHMKDVPPYHCLHTILGDYSLFDYVYSALEN